MPPSPKSSFWTLLPARGVLAVTDADRRSFLQGLVSNDVERAGSDRAVYAAFLTAQGRFLHDFLMVGQDEMLLLDCEAERRDDLRQRLSRYRLRAKVAIEDRTADLAVGVLAGPEAARLAGVGAEPGAAGPFGGGVAFVDPRLAGLGVRVIAPRDGIEAALAATGLAAGGPDDWDRLRLSLGVPDGSRDMPAEKALLLESNLDELHGIDWRKGCYIGQELTARTKYRGLLKRRLMPVAFDGPAPEAGATVSFEGKDAGEMRTARDGMGLALLRIEHAEAAERGEGVLAAGDTALRVLRPDWLPQPEPKAG
jgi:folate-binding protein YgfZ